MILILLQLTLLTLKDSDLLHQIKTGESFELKLKCILASMKNRKEIKVEPDMTNDYVTISPRTIFFSNAFQVGEIDTIYAGKRLTLTCDNYDEIYKQIVALYKTEEAQQFPAGYPSK